MEETPENESLLIKKKKAVDETNAIEIRTGQTAPFRILIEALKDILTDVNFIIDKKGIKLTTMDPAHVTLVHFKLHAENFEEYICKNRMVLGICMNNFYKLIKPLGNNDTLTLYVKENNINYLGIKIENSEKNQVTDYKLNLMDISEEGIKIPAVTFDTIISMYSQDFQKLIRDMYNIGEVVEIKSFKNKIIMTCTGDFASQETYLGETTTGLNFKKKNENETIIQGLYSIKHLVLFTKCTGLCSNIDLYLKNDYPLILQYNVANLGYIRICLSPKSNDN
jgi:proliferating cell nuclear antigen